MAGHSKWANIKHKKSREDAKRGKAFTKIIKEITVAARSAGGDPDHNPKLRQLIDKAKNVNMPKENIVRAIKKGTGELPGVNYESIEYEGYGPHGIAVLVEVLTDNKNRAVADLRHLFSSKGGNLGESGSVKWMFERLGIVRAKDEIISENDLLEKLIDFDIVDLKKYDDIFSIVCESKSLDMVKKAVESIGLKVESAELEWIPKTPVGLPENQAEKVYDFLNTLDDLDDVQNVYSNLE